MKVLEKVEKDNLVVKIVDEIPSEKEYYELKRVPDMSEADKKSLGTVIRRYLKSYARHKDTMSMEDWLTMMYREDFPNLNEKELHEKVMMTISRMNKNYDTYKKVKSASSIGISPSEYFAMETEKSEEYKKLTLNEKREILTKVDSELTEEAVDELYTLNDMGDEKNISKTMAKTFGQSVINSYFGKIDNAINVANSNMQDTILTKSGVVSQNPNLDGFIAESHHANTFNVDAATKEINLNARDLKPDVYTKNSVDIVVEDANGKIVLKAQAKMGKNTESTADMFYDKDNQYKYKFQRKLVPKGQSDEINNAVDHLEVDGVESEAISKEELKDMQEKVQSGDTHAADVGYENVNTHELLKKVGYKSVRNAVYGAAIGAGLSIGKKLITGEEIEAEEVIATAIKTGATSGVSTAVYGAMQVGVKKGVLKGLLSKSTVVSAIAFSCVEAISTVFKVGSGEMTFQEGLDSLGEIFTTGLIISQAMAYSGGAIATLGAFMGASALAMTVSGVVCGAVVAVAGAAVAKPVWEGVKTVVGGVVSGAKAVVSAGVEAVKSMASCVGSVVSSVASGIGSVVSSVGSFIGGFFGW